jgi:hypothetical protein
MIAIQTTVDIVRKKQKNGKIFPAARGKIGVRAESDEILCDSKINPE